MKVLGFTFTKISGERLKASAGEVKVTNEIDITDLIQPKIDSLNTKDSIFEAKFKYNVNYEPHLAKISIEGKVAISVDSKEGEEISKQWKSKKLPDSFRSFLVNIVMRKSTLKSLTLCDELNLPVNIPIPTLKSK